MSGSENYTHEQNLGNGFRIVLYGSIDPEDFSNSKLVVLRGPVNNPDKLEPIAGYTFKNGTIVAKGYRTDALAIILMPFYLTKKIPDLMHALTRRLLADLCGYIKNRDKQKEIVKGENISLHFEFSEDHADACVSAYSEGKMLFEYVAQRADNYIAYSNQFNLENLLHVLETVSNNTIYPVQMRLMVQDLMCGLLPETQQELELIIAAQQQEAIAKIDAAEPEPEQEEVESGKDNE